MLDIIPLRSERMIRNASFNCGSNPMRLVYDSGHGTYGRAGGLLQNYGGRNIIREGSFPEAQRKEIVSVADYMQDTLIC